MPPRVLIVAGSDSGGGAGIQADIKTVTALGGYAMTAVTALTAQNTRGVFGIHAVPPEFIVQQMQVVLEDIGADAIKTGMLATSDVIEAVASALDRFAPAVPVVVDPVMVAKGGARLLATEAVEAMMRHLLPRAAVITPNLPEAEALTGRPVASVDDMTRAAETLLAAGARAVLVKGGHLEGDTVVDVLMTAAGDAKTFAGTRIHTASTHGTGCTLASAITAGLAAGLPVVEAVSQARAYLRRAIEQAPGLGHGHGPLWHGHTVQPFAGRS